MKKRGAIILSADGVPFTGIVCDGSALHSPYYARDVIVIWPLCKKAVNS